MVLKILKRVLQHAHAETAEQNKSQYKAKNGVCTLDHAPVYVFFTYACNVSGKGLLQTSFRLEILNQS